MPIFEYECQHCGQVFEELVASNRIADSEIECPACNRHAARKRMSAPAIGGFSTPSTGTASAPACGHGGFT